MTWSAKQYVAFEDERTRPVRDLLAALPAIETRTAIDIGCGPGNSTELLAARFPGAVVTGLDSSPDMIAAARQRLPGLTFAIDDIERWLYENTAENAELFGVILANAVLQWVPHHATVFPALAAKLARGGSLAVQMPDNFDQPSHRLMREIAASGPWRAKLAGAVAVRTPIAAAEWYYELLRSMGCKADVWRTTYYHSLSGGSLSEGSLSGGGGAIVEWFKGSGLRPFIAPLDDDERAEFLRRYQDGVARAYPASLDGSVLLPFPRLFIVAIR
jgi:trans-aconitate 2-methyltransferase